MGLIRNDLPVEAAGITLELRRMCLPRNLLQRYGDLATEAVREMELIETGGIGNVDEGRRVGHYWLRDPARAPREFQEAIPDTWKAIESFAADKFQGQFENILWIGIGGSGLAPQMLFDALRKPGQLPRMFFLDNTDPSGFAFTLAEIAAAGGFEKTLVVVVSKSGSTPETYNGMFVAQEAYREVGVDFASRAVAITQPGSQLEKEAATWLARFPIWDWVGGRTSLFSAVGLLPAKLIGGDLHALLAGAREMDQATRDDHLHQNLALLMAVSWFHAVETSGLRNMVVLPYCDRLSLFGKYLQQLIMESVGKDLKGISVFGNKGSTDQHSYVQQLREGYADFFAVFVRTVQPTKDWKLKHGFTVGDYLAAFQEGTAQALAEAGRPSMRLSLQQVDERRLGALVALFERAVGYYGAILGVNAYHQPGVEAGKKAAEGILDVQEDVLSQLRTAERSVTELAKQTQASVWLVFDILDRLARCQRCGVTRVSDASLPISEQVFAIQE